jgi:hypothetical protein
MNLVRFTLIFFLFVTSACDPKSKQVNFQPDIEMISIPISEVYLNSYQVLDSYSENGVNKLIAYNPSRHALDYFDLDEAIALKSINLSLDGPNGVGRIESIYWHNSDSIFLYERGKVHLLKEGGEKSTSYDLYGLFNGKNLGEPVCNFYFKLNYLAKEKLIFFSLIHHGANLEERSNLPLVASVNIATLEVKALPISHTNHYKKVGGNVGFITYLGFHSFMKNQMIYNYQYESSLFSFNPKNQAGTSSISHEDKYTPELIDLENIDQHAIDNPHFLTPIPDNYRNLIYRGTWDSPDPSLNESGFTEKKISISVFDSELSLLSKFDLPNYTYQINNWFVNKNGLYLNYAHPRNEKVSEDFLVFHVFQFDKNSGEK